MMNRPMTETPATTTRPDWNQLAEEIHRNAVDHGWYEQPPAMPSVLANIHAELSEAWEAYREHRPMVYYPCNISSMQRNDERKNGGCAGKTAEENGSIAYPEQKPEGIAIELADAVIRMLDACGHEQLDIAAAMAHTPALLGSYARAFLRQENADVPFADLLSYLQEVIACAHLEYRIVPDKADRHTESYFAECILLISDYISRFSDTTLTECIRIKHAYNLTRPYRHGGKVV